MGITNKFISSFSELYIADRDGANFNALYNAASTKVAKNVVVRNFFSPAASVDLKGAGAIALNGIVSYGYSLGDSSYKVHFRVKALTTADGNTSGSPTAILTKTYLNTLGLNNSAVVSPFDIPSVLEFISTRVPLVMEIGTLGNEATVIDTPEFGEEFKGKLRGQADGGQLDSSVFWAPGNSVHNWLQRAAIDGISTTAGIIYKGSKIAAPSNQRLAVFNSFISSFNIETAFDDVMKASMTQPVDGAEYFADGA